MTWRTAQPYRELAEAAWRWVLNQVRWDDGPWFPESVTGSQAAEMSEYRDGMHSGVGGLAHVLAEIRLTRRWTAAEEDLATAIAERLRGGIAAATDYTFFDGLVSAIGVFGALGVDGAEAAADRLTVLGTPDGWPGQSSFVPPRFLPGARTSDVVLGTGGVLLGAVWAGRLGAATADDLAERAAAVLIAEAEPVPTGLNWLFVPRRFWADAPAQLPNFSHGVAGIATALALAGARLGRPDLVSAALRGAEHLVSLGVRDGAGFVVPRRIAQDPPARDEEEFSYGWCHGAAGTSLLFLALQRAGVEDVAGAPPLTWHRRCLHSVRTSGLPARLRPGFWDNDGRCCGTAGVGDLFLDSWQRGGEQEDLDFALRLADTLVERAVRDEDHAYWRFVEHRAAEPLLAPQVGWLQGAAGIAAFLFRAGRVLRDGPSATAVHRMDNWWALPNRPEPQLIAG